MQKLLASVVSSRYSMMARDCNGKTLLEERIRSAATILGGGVGLGVAVGLDLGVAVGVGLGVAVGVGLGVAVGVGLGVDLGVGLGVAVEMSVGVAVRVGVAIARGVDLDVEACGWSKDGIAVGMRRPAAGLTGGVETGVTN